MSRRLTVTVLAMLLCTSALAEERSWNVGFSLGAGQRTNPLASGHDIDLWWSVDVAWFGRRWFFDNGDIGFTLHDDHSSTLSWVARLNTERAFFSELDEGLFNRAVLSAGDLDSGLEQAATDGIDIEIPDRDYALETGLEYLLDRPWGRLHAQAMADVSGVHQGFDLWLSVSNDYVVGRWHFVPSASVNWKSRKLNDYYYGVRANEAIGALTEYRASAGVNVALKMSASYYISERWRFIATVDYERINSSAADSPLLAEEYIGAYFLGIHHAF